MVVRGVGGPDPHGNIPINRVAGRLADLIPQANKLKVISQSTDWSEGVADLLPHEDKLKVISQVADLIPDEDKWKVKSHST